MWFEGQRFNLEQRHPADDSKACETTNCYGRLDHQFLGNPRMVIRDISYVDKWGGELLLFKL